MSITHFPNGISSFGNVINPGFGFGVGNVYYVCQTTNTVVYADMVLKYGGQTYDNDGSAILHTTIASALSATVANRDDYVIVCTDSSDYDLTAALSMDKKGVHLIAPGGLGTNGIGMNAVRLDCTADASAMTSTADAIEFAGFFIKGYLNTSALILFSSTRWHNNIHDNFVGIKASSAGSANYGIFGAGACSHMAIHRNYVTVYLPAAMTGADNACAGGIVFTSGSCTRNVISNNIVTTGANTTMALGIQDVGDQAIISNNRLLECPAFGGVYDASTLTLGIQSSVTSLVTDNRVAIATAGNAVIGGTADQTYVQNFEGTSGGTAAT